MNITFDHYEAADAAMTFSTTVLTVFDNDGSSLEEIDFSIFFNE
jgi:hypothetical protein